ncbi:MAG: hypothetical protein ACR2L1_00470 [Pyrinomonadaceae bacterium]
MKIQDFLPAKCAKGREKDFARESARINTNKVLKNIRADLCDSWAKRNKLSRSFAGNFFKNIIIGNLN